MTHPTEPKLPESLEAIRSLCTGLVEWRVAREDGAYCMSFDRYGWTDPERAANQWLERHQREYPHRFMPYKVRRVFVQSQLQEEALALIVRLSDAESALKARDAEIERLRGVLSALLSAVQKEMSPEWECNSYHPDLVQAVKLARAEGGEKTND